MDLAELVGLRARRLDKQEVSRPKSSELRRRRIDDGDTCDDPRDATSREIAYLTAGVRHELGQSMPGAPSYREHASEGDAEVRGLFVISGAYSSRGHVEESTHHLVSHRFAAVRHERVDPIDVDESS